MKQGLANSFIIFKKDHNFHTRQPGFTIVELLVVIVIIGVLAAITIISYTNIQQKAVASSLQSDLSNASQQLKIFQVVNNAYPGSIADCPTPAANNMCLKYSSGNSYQYAASNATNPQTFSITATNGTQIYSIGQNSSATTGGQNLLTGDTSIAKSSANEFLQYADLALIFDNYGIRQYTISFDIKSANIATQSSTQVYMQNGSGARYTFSVFVPVTTSYVRKSVTITPSLSDPGLTQSILAFYGTYGSGNISTVKNVKVELGSVATPWTQAP